MEVDIKQTIPHRPPFLFIDEMVAMDADGASARRTVRADEDYFKGHYPGNPIMPGVLLCEAAFQTAAVYLVKKFEAEGQAVDGLTPVLSRITDARFKSMVKPGDEIEIQVKMHESVSKFHFLKADIRRGSKLVLKLSFALALIEEKDT